MRQRSQVAQPRGHGIGQLYNGVEGSEGFAVASLQKKEFARGRVHNSVVWRQQQSLPKVLEG
eukprot:3661695-Amphidinium_carterae.1